MGARAVDFQCSFGRVRSVLAKDTLFNAPRAGFSRPTAACVSRPKCRFPGLGRIAGRSTAESEVNERRLSVCATSGEPGAEEAHLACRSGIALHAALYICQSSRAMACNYPNNRVPRGLDSCPSKFESDFHLLRLRQITPAQRPATSCRSIEIPRLHSDD